MKSGSRVLVNFDANGKWCPGKISRENRDGSFDIAFDDGDAGQNVPSNQIQRSDLSKTKATPVFKLRSQVRVHRDGKW